MVQWYFSVSKESEYCVHCQSRFLACLHSLAPPLASQRSEEEEDKRRLKDREKKHLSLLEEKLTDALTLLLQLCNKAQQNHSAHTHTIHLRHRHTYTSSLPSAVYSISPFSVYPDHRPHLLFQYVQFLSPVDPVFLLTEVVSIVKHMYFSSQFQIFLLYKYNCILGLIYRQKKMSHS